MVIHILKVLLKMEKSILLMDQFVNIILKMVIFFQKVLLKMVNFILLMDQFVKCIMKMVKLK